MVGVIVKGHKNKIGGDTMNYTKGKWRALPYGNNKYYVDTETRQLTGNISREDAQLIATSVNACIKINPNNPQAVADSIVDMYEACKKLLMHRNLNDLHPIDFQRIEQALSKAEGGTA